MSLTIRIGFIGVDGSSIALAAEPTARASAVVFSAIDQLRRYFETNRNRASNAWMSLFHEIGQANIRDAEERQQQQQQQTSSVGGPHQKSRIHAKRVISRKISLMSANGEKFIPGHELINGTVEQVFFQQHQNFHHHHHESDSGNIFYWMDLTDPACRVQLAAFRHSSSSKNRNALECFFSEVIDQTPFIASWNVEKIFQRVSEKSSSSFFVHPHDLECYLITNPNENNDNNMNGSSYSTTSTLLQRDAPLLDLFRYSRFVNLEVHVCRPPSVTVRVVEADVAEIATKNLYSKLGFSSAPNDFHDDPSYYYYNLVDSSRVSPSRRYNQNQTRRVNNLGELTVQNPYNSSADPYTFVEIHSRRTISLSGSTSSTHHSIGLSISWSTTLSDLHREAAKFIAPLKGKGFVCLEPALILKSAEAAANGDHGGATLKLASTGKPNGSQIPVFSPDLTLRQVHRLMMNHRNKGNAAAMENFSSSVASCKLYLLVNSHEKETPKMIFARTEYSDDILREADDVRFQLLDVLYPASRETRLLQQIGHNNKSSSSTIFKKQNVVPGSPEDTHLHVTNNFRYRENNNNKSVHFQLLEDDNHHNQNNTFVPPQNHQQISSLEAAPTSPVHTEGVEAFISIPAVPSSSSSSKKTGGAGEVVRLLLPDGYFPVRRLKRFLRTQNNISSDAGADYQIQFGTKILNDDDEDVKHYVNPDTNVVFLNAF